MVNRASTFLGIVVLLWSGSPALGAVFLVGPEMPLNVPSKAAAIAQDGDIIQIEAAVYDGDVAVWTQNDIVIRGIGGRPHIRANGKSAEFKAIWVIKGDNTRVENIEFSGASVPDRNGAGIRLEGTNLTIVGCYFHHNENGLLTGADPSSHVIIENSEFAHNGYGDGQSHNMYLGRIAKFTLRSSYSHHARVGHLVKSRAEQNILMFNRLSDELSGTSSYLIDLPNPGRAVVVGNVLQQGTQAENWALIRSAQPIKLVNNTLVNDRGSGIFLQLVTDEGGSLVQNNLFVGVGSIKGNNLRKINNLMTEDPGFESRVQYDYRLTPPSPAIDAGQPVDDAEVVPVAEYLHKHSEKPRKIIGGIDIGAHEYDPNNRDR